MPFLGTAFIVDVDNGLGFHEERRTFLYQSMVRRKPSWNET